MTAGGLTKVLPYFRAVMNDLGHKEWRDAIPDDNIPNTIIHRSYHLLIATVGSARQNQSLIEMECPIGVTLIVKGYKDTSSGMDLAVTYEEEILKKALENFRRAATYDGIKNVKFVSGEIKELNKQTDNIFRITMIFNCSVATATT